MRTSSIVLTFAVAFAGVVAGGAVVDTVRASDSAVTPSAPPAAASAEDLERLEDVLAGQGGGGDAQWLDRTLRETLPNFTISRDGAPGTRVFEATIDGVVRDVRPGTGARDSVRDDDTVQRDELAFDDPAANWRTVVLTVEVRDDFDPETAMPSEIDVVVWLDGATDPDVVREGFSGQRIFAVLEEPGRLAPADAYPVARNGALIGVVRDDGSLSFPGLGVDEGLYVDGLTTISAIQAAAEAPAVVLPLSLENGSWERTG